MTRLQAGNAITLFKSGAEFFPALESAILGAEREVHLQSYIYSNDTIGTRLTRVLTEAARRGVAVRLLVDGFGSQTFLRSDAVQDLERAGGRVLAFRPWRGIFRLRRHRLRRMHRKLAVVDGRMAFIGGINIVDDFEQPRSTTGRLDYALCVQGPVLADIHAAACSLWGRVSWSHLKRRWRPARRIDPVTDPCGEVQAALLLRDNLKHRHDIEDAYLEAINTARSEVLIANAYFFPSRRFREALARAVQRGVQVTLLLQGRVEYWLQHYASRALYADLLRAGIQIHEYHWSFLHAKVAVVDQAWLTVGSSNIEPLSLLLAKEANLVVIDQGVAGALRASVVDEMRRGGRRVEREQWEALPLLERVLCRLALRVASIALTFTVNAGDRHFR